MFKEKLQKHFENQDELNKFIIKIGKRWVNEHLPDVDCILCDWRLAKFVDDSIEFIYQNKNDGGIHNYTVTISFNYFERYTMENKNEN